MRRLVLLSDFVMRSEALTMNLVHEVLAADAARCQRIAADRGADWPAARRWASRSTKEWWRLMGDDAVRRARWSTRARRTRRTLRRAGSRQARAKFVSREKV